MRKEFYNCSRSVPPHMNRPMLILVTSSLHEVCVHDPEAFHHVQGQEHLVQVFYDVDLCGRLDFFSRHGGRGDVGIDNAAMSILVSLVEQIVDF